MILKKRLSLLLSLILILCLFNSPGIAYAEVSPYYGIDVSTYHSSAFDILFSPNDKLYVSEYSGNGIISMDKSGNNKSTFFSPTTQPLGMTFDRYGNLYVAEHAGRSVLKIDSSGNSSIVSNFDTLLTGIAIDSQNKLFVLDYSSGKIFKMDLDGTNKTTFADELGTSSIIGLTIDSNDNLYISSRSNGKIIKISPDGTERDFITNLGYINEVKLGNDGFLYAPNANSRTIDKFDLNGDKLGSFNVNTSNVWAIEVDTDGSIYFSDGSTIRRILGSAATIDTRHIELELNKDMIDGLADPEAFTLSGASSNPQITEAVVNGNVIDLTLDSGITALDTELKLNYNKTGEHDLTVSGSGVLFSNFANMPVSNRILKVNSIAPISQINVENGTDLNEVPLPSHVMLNISDSSTTTASVSWYSSTPEYNGNIEGTYAFTGTVEITDDNISNPNNHQAHVNVAVGEVTKPNVDSVEPLSDITVSRGTSVNSINFPSFVNINLSNSITTSAAVTWDISSSLYNSETAGTYIFTGSIDPSAEFLNPGDLRANLNVIVKANSKNSGGSIENSPENKADDNTVIKINNDSFNIGSENINVENGIKTAEVSILKNTIEKIIDDTIKNAAENQAEINNVVEINVNDKTSINSTIALTGDIVKKLEDNNFEILINRDNISYKIPAAMLDVNALADRMSLNSNELQKIRFEIKINKYTSEKNALFNQKIEENNSKMLVEPFEFKIAAISEGNNGFNQVIEISKFTNYVERTFKAPDNFNDSDIATGVVFDSDYSYSSVPTIIFTENGIRYIKLKSLTNSTYSIISSPVSVNMPENHWATSTINTMASKLIITDTNNFNPNKKITRAELAEYLTRSLGIYRADGEYNSKFNDVDSKNINYTAITSAHSWNILNGYPDGTFKPDSLVTREEAIAMYANAMDTAKIQDVESSTLKLDDESTSSWALPSIIKVTNAGIFRGRNSESLDLKENLTHAEALAAIEKLLNVAELS